MELSVICVRLKKRTLNLSINKLHHLMLGNFLIFEKNRLIYFPSKKIIIIINYKVIKTDFNILGFWGFGALFGYLVLSLTISW